MYTNQPTDRLPRPRRRGPLADPFIRRLAVLVLGFFLLLPIAIVFSRGDGGVVKANGLPGATLTATPIEAARTTVAGATVPPATTGAAPPTTAQAKPVSSVATKPATATAKPSSATVASKPRAKTKARAARTTPALKAKAKPAPARAPKPVVAPAPPPVATPAPPVTTYTAAQVEAIIRQVWPAALADQAIAIAYRESHLTPTSHNWCCYGIFAIYFDVGRTLLASLGVTTPAQLYDPAVNARAAYAIYLAAGWGPWKL